MHPISAIIRQRRAIFTATFTDQRIEDALIMELLENANHAPTHKFTQPWRFRVVTDNARLQMAEALTQAYTRNTPPAQFSELKCQKTSQNALRASHIIAIACRPDPQAALPEWEEIAATAMAVQNIWLSAAALGLGGYWSSPAWLDDALLRRFLGWNPNEKGLGFFYLGYHDTPTAPPKRSPITEKTQWIR